MNNWQDRIVGQGRKPADQFQANPQNFRKHPQKQRHAMRASLDDIGWIAPVIENVNTGNLLDGHERVWQALQNDNADVPFIQVDIAPEDEGKVLAVFDQITNMAEIDTGLLDEVLQGIQTDSADLAEFLSGFAEDNGLYFGEQEEAPDDPGVDLSIADQLREKWGTETGQLWRLGEHRLICGDCTDAAVVARLMGGEKARMVFTDPPYGIGKDIENDNLRNDKLQDFYKKWVEVVENHIIENAYLYVWGYFQTLSPFWEETLKQRKYGFRNFIIWRKNCIQGINSQEFRQFPEEYEACLLVIFGNPFENGAWSTSPNAEYYPEMFEPIRAYLDEQRNIMGWDIPTVKKMVGHSDLSRDHWFNRSQWSMPTREVYETLQREAGGLAFTAQYDELRAQYDELRAQYDELRAQYDELRAQYDELRGYFDNTNGLTDIWEFDGRYSTTSLHPTVKPLEVCQRGIVSTSKKGEIVLDVFGGSGSTLLACEQTGRIARLSEIDPDYIAVTLERWHQMTGEMPELVDAS